MSTGFEGWDKTMGGGGRLAREDLCDYWRWVHRMSRDCPKCFVVDLKMRPWSSFEYAEEEVKMCSQSTCFSDREVFESP